jgi:hypothetical protein
MKKAAKATWSINDINNAEGADRKIVINGLMEFWVHDAALAQSSGYFKELFCTCGYLTLFCSPR